MALFTTMAATTNYITYPIVQQACFNTGTITNSAMTSTYTTTVWQDWVATANYYTTSIVWNNWCVQQAEVSAEQLELLVEQQAREAQALEEQRRAAEEVYRKRAEEKKLAGAKARQLLLSLLDEEQEKQYQANGSFELRTDRGRYRINPGDRVEELDPAGKVLARFCIHPPDYEMPREDWAIAQKLMLETDEETFHRVANRRAA